MLGLSQSAVAEQIGVTRARILIHDYQRSPLKADLALRFCRQFIISEEWLATGTHTDLLTALNKAGVIEIGADVSEASSFWRRHCLDLHSEPEALDIPPGMYFGEAFDSFLKEKNFLLAQKFSFTPRVVFRDSDGPELVGNFFNALFQLWLSALSSEARRLELNEGFARRSFLRVVFQTTHVLFKRYMNAPTPEIEGHSYNFLRAIALSIDTPIGPLHTPSEGSEKKPST